MGVELQVHPNDSVFIRIQLAKNDTGLFPQTKIYAIDDPATVVDTIDLEEIGDGLYGLEWTNNGERKKYFTQTIVYTDSGHTNVHAVIRPDSDSINVGFNASGFSFGGKGGGTTRIGLLKEEIEEIAKAVFKLIKPELDKKSEFNAEKDVVKTDVVIPDVVIPEFPDAQTISDKVYSRFAIDEKLKNLMTGVLKEISSIKFPEIPEFPKIPDNINEIKKIQDELKTSRSDIKKSIDSIDVTPIISQMTKLVEEFKSEFARYKVLLMIANNETPSAIYQELSELPRKDIEKMIRGVLSKNKKLTSSLVSVSKR